MLIVTPAGSFFLIITFSLTRAVSSLRYNVCFAEHYCGGSIFCGNGTIIDISKYTESSRVRAYSCSECSRGNLTRNDTVTEYLQQQCNGKRLCDVYISEYAAQAAIQYSCIDTRHAITSQVPRSQTLLICIIVGTITLLIIAALVVVICRKMRQKSTTDDESFTDSKLYVDARLGQETLRDTISVCETLESEVRPSSHDNILQKEELANNLVHEMYAPRYVNIQSDLMPIPPAAHAVNTAPHYTNEPADTCDRYHPRDPTVVQ